MRANVQTLFTEALNLAREGKYDRALDCLDRVLEIDPEHVRARYNKGVCFFKQGRLRESSMVFRELIPDCPGDADIYNNMGNIMSRTGQHDKARVCFEKALQLDPNHAAALCALGIVAGKIEGDTQEAMRLFQKALEANHDLARAHQGLAICYHHLGDYDNGIKHLHKALKMDSGNSAVHNHLGIMHQKLGHHQEADKHFELARKLDPESRFRHENLWQMDD